MYQKQDEILNDLEQQHKKTTDNLKNKSGKR